MPALDGIKVLELARVAPAELPGMLLADMGADVLKIDTPPAAPESEESKRHAAFVGVNRNKRSLALNMKSPDGQAIFKRLVAAADVVIEGFRPGVMKRLGADWDTLRAINSRLVYCSLSGFGQNGPYRDCPAHDGNYLALAGILGLIGEAGRKPVFPLNLVADYGGASLHGALGIMFALFARERTGLGQYVDVAYLDTSVALLGATPNMRYFFSDGIVPKRGGSFVGGGYPFYAVYETKDAKFLTICCVEQRLWENFCKVINRPDLIRFAMQPDQFVRDAAAQEIETREEVQAIIRTKSRDEWHDLLVKADVCAGKVYDPDEMVADPQVKARDMIAQVQHPTYGAVKQFGIPIKLSATPGAVRTAAPAIGENTDQVLRELGMSNEDITKLRETKIIA